MARLGVPVGGRVRRLHAVEDQAAPLFFHTKLSSLTALSAQDVMPTEAHRDCLSPTTNLTAAGSLNRSLTLWNSLTIGFATVSPVAGLYAIIGVQTVVTGGGWFGALALCLVMQMLVATVYAELSSQIPIAGVRTSGHGSLEVPPPGSMPESSTLAPRSRCLPQRPIPAVSGLRFFLDSRVEEGSP